MRSLLFSAIFLFFLPLICKAQYDDFQTWTSITLEKSLSKKLKGSIEEQLRLRENSTRLRQLYTDVSLKYDVTKNFSVAVNYRFIIRPDVIDHRIYSDISYQFIKSKLEITPRIRLEHDFLANMSDKDYIRGKVTGSYAVIKKWKPFVSGELFYPMFSYENRRFDEYRLSAGLGYDFNKKHSLKVFFLRQQEFNVNAANQNHILGIGYEYDL